MSAVRDCLFSIFEISETTERISITFRIDGLHKKMLDEFNFGTYQTDITLDLHEVRIELQLKNCYVFRSTIHVWNVSGFGKYLTKYKKMSFLILYTVTAAVWVT
jgi:hypothetical protein